MNEGSAKQQIVEGIKANTNILVTVSDSPSVDELSAALALTLLLNKIEKRATAIFSGAVPAAITFLDPDKTFEGTVDSLRDFIIALDKEKADHLRYKVEGDVVKIFITPYRTTLTDKDLEFTQGDYNVEMVIALGVKDPDHLDKALAAHGRILHDALVSTISTGTDPSNLGSVDWRDGVASSLCEMLVSLSEALKGDTPILDEQIASAFLTGIVSATDRFSNERTSSRVMTMAAQLMAAGADQQLIAAKLQESHDIPSPPVAVEDKKDSQDDSQKEDTTKKDKKSKKDENSLRIDRHDKKSNDKKEDSAPKDAEVEPPKDESKNDEPKSELDSAVEASAVAAAVEQAEPAKDVEQELAKKLDEVNTPPAPVLPEDLEKELNDALVSEPIVDELPPVETELPAVQQQTSTEDTGMPGFEALDVPALPPLPPIVEPEEPAAPAPHVSTMIKSNSGSDYLGAKKESFDTPVDSIIGGSDEASPQTDPFSAPLPPMPSISDLPQLPADDATDDAAAQPPVNVAADQPIQTPIATLDDLEKSITMPDSAMPPLPPLPDFSTLPPLPNPPSGPVFDQPAPIANPQQSGGISSDKLGDIFGDAAAQQDAPPPQAPPSAPGQFRIPGQ